ncbi:MAG: hypothetical protein JSV91_01965 [Phycisphaerales bacterium]|nr:MAG: hypothetical protein JSV91_01965 [Phycisphaerales bacterium]
MYRSNRITCGAMAIIASLLLLCPVSDGDDIAAYLENHGLTELLAIHLEEQLDQVTGDRHDELLQRLASIYALLLETTEDPLQRASLEQRSRRLLVAAPNNTADALRLALLRGSYRSAELIAERHRLRLSSPEEVEDARELLAEVIPDLTGLGKRLTELGDLKERRLSRAAGSEAAAISDEIEQVHRLHTQCTFLSAWALYYQSYLHERPDNARAAEPLFAELLGSQYSHPRPEDISLDLRAMEPFARSMLGMAMCKSLTASSPTALEWLDLLEHETTFPPLRRELPAWRMVIHLENGEFAAAQRILEQVLDEYDRPSLPPAWLRLAAARALEAESNARQARELKSLAVTELASRGELKQILDLAGRYGVEALGGSGFVLGYVQGVLSYDEARSAHDDEQPTLRPDLIALYGRAVEHLTVALEEPDAADYQNAAAACRRLVAWCRYFQSRFLEARTDFETASERLPPEDAPEALWMAIVCLDRAVEAGADGGIEDELARLIDQFLNRYPGSEHAATLVYRRALAADEISPEIVAELLAVEPASEVYEAAQARAAQMLYQLFRNSTGDERLAYANEYLAVAVGLLAADERRIDPAEPLAIQRFVVRCRRILEVSLTDGVGRLVAAAGALRAFDELAATRSFDASALADEIDYRRTQERLGWDDVRTAGSIADSLWSRDPDSDWTRLAQRAMFRHARRAWKDPADEAGDDRGPIALVIHFGQRVLEEYEDDPQSLSDPAVLGYFAVVGEALMTRWMRSGSESDGRTALALYDLLIRVRPRNGVFLRSLAVLCERLGHTERALGYWRRLVAGRAMGSEEWYEAKYHLLELLYETDPQRAREVMDQHRQLNREYGPAPWGARLKGLDQRIDERLGRAAAEGGEGRP